MRNAEKVLEYMHNSEYVIIANNRIFDSNLVAFFRSNFDGGDGEGKISLSTVCCCQREDIKVERA